MMAEVIEPFEFKQCISIRKSKGIKAKNLHELRDGIATVSNESIFHHTYQYFLKGPMLEYTNDFAHWAGEGLEERSLAEALSNIDPYDYTEIEDLRNTLLDVIDYYLKAFPEPREVIPGEEFYFHEPVTFIFPVGIRAKNLAEFLMAIRYVDIGSIYFHFYEARVRLGGGIDDFSRWFDQALGKLELAEKIRSIDPFMNNIEKIRERIAEAVEEEVRKDMEVIHT